jgi:hypothetical protein
MSSEKRSMRPNDFDRDVPPLNSSRGSPEPRPLKRRSSVQENPEVFLDVLDRGPQTSSRREKQFPAFVVCCSDHMAIGVVHHGWTGADGGLLETL